MIFRIKALKGKEIIANSRNRFEKTSYLKFSLSKENSVYLTHTHVGAAVEILDTIPKRASSTWGMESSPHFINKAIL